MEENTTVTLKEIKWHKYPDTKPDSNKQLKDYLVKSIEKNAFGEDRPVYRICSWVNWDEMHGWFYNGNEFWLKEFEYLDLESL